MIRADTQLMHPVYQSSNGAKYNTMRRRRSRRSMDTRSIRLCLFASLFSCALTQSLYTESTLPSVDLSSLGRVALVGDFAGISVADYPSQYQNASLLVGDSDALLTQLPNGAFAQLGQTDGTISALCALFNGSMSSVYIAGQFNQIGGINATNIAVWDQNTAQFSALPDRMLLGKVDSLFCDSANNSVYVGGDFLSANSSNAIQWVVGQGWVDLPFGGFNGEVYTIAQSSNNNIVFGGSFDATGNGSLPLSSNNGSDGQVINLATGNVTSEASSATAGFSDPVSLLCSNGLDGPSSTWLLNDNAPGSVTFQSDVMYRPTKFRIKNTNYQGRGSQTFRITALPIDGILNLTYSDPVSGRTLNCDARCPLPTGSNATYQDYTCVNVIGVTGFRLDISEWVGAGGGLNSLEVFTGEINAYAVDSYNEPACRVSGYKSTSTNNWSLEPEIWLSRYNRRLSWPQPWKEML